MRRTNTSNTRRKHPAAFRPASRSRRAIDDLFLFLGITWNQDLTAHSGRNDNRPVLNLLPASVPCGRPALRSLTLGPSPLRGEGGPEDRCRRNWKAISPLSTQWRGGQGVRLRRAGRTGVQEALTSSPSSPPADSR